MTDAAKALQLLGLAKRAGKLISGEELVVKSLQNRRCQLVFLASDASENLTKKITDKATFNHISVSRQFTTDELSNAIGQNRKVIAVENAGFAKSMEKTLMM
ncbi:MAG: YlxQ-related RNA-binding protein [Streptococcaceae bacterium]|jgi:ribosomal protein L7Ae-like RNA K-turn-binding protein|nr:YlxQ-related RNA-binding protein [Streptococcaceae bacterium]